MARADQVEVRMRIVIEQPVPGVLHSLQAKNDSPLDPKRSWDGEQLAFDLTIRVGNGPKFFGDQVRREGAERRFVYIGVGQAAGDPGSEWSRRMKIDIHDTPQHLMDEALAGSALEFTVCGTGKDGTPACATVRPTSRRVV